MKHALTAASLVLVAGMAVGCGDGGGDSAKDSESQAPTTAEFCTSYNSLYDKMQAAGKTPSQSEIIKTVKEWGVQLKEVGTPEDMPADVKSGYDVGLNTVESMADDATQQDLQKMDDALSADQKKDAQAFQAWVTKTCPLESPKG